MYETIKQVLRRRVDNYKTKTREQKLVYDAMFEGGIKQLMDMGYSEMLIYKALLSFQICSLTNPRFLAFLEENKDSV